MIRLIWVFVVWKSIYGPICVLEYYFLPKVAKTHLETSINLQKQHDPGTSQKIDDVSISSN